MTESGICRQVTAGSKNESRHISNVVEYNDKIKIEDTETVIEPLVTSRYQKSESHSEGQLEEVKEPRSTKRRRNTTAQKVNKTKQTKSLKRWSTERLKWGEQILFEIMKAEGAVYNKPISRSALRMAARKHIGDTGLLDHLLKHIVDELTPGGDERYRRWHTTNGQMSYWIESTDSRNIKQEDGVLGPWGRSDGVFHESGELQLLKDELARTKSEMRELVSKPKEQYDSGVSQEMQKECVRRRATTDKHLMEISSSLSDMLGMYKELVTWKAKAEHQLSGISNSLSTIQASTRFNSFSLAPQSWDSGDWIESANLDSILEGEEFKAWLENSDVHDIGQRAVVKDLHPAIQAPPHPSSSPTLDPVSASGLKEEMTRTKRDAKELEAKIEDNDLTNMTSDIKLSDIDKSVTFFQERCKELMAWKTKTEQQMVEMSNTVIDLQSSRR